MLVSPLMGPVMSITFGAMISDRSLIVSKYLSIEFRQKSSLEIDSFICF